MLASEPSGTPVHAAPTGHPRTSSIDEGLGAGNRGEEGGREGGREGEGGGGRGREGEGGRDGGNLVLYHQKPTTKLRNSGSLWYLTSIVVYVVFTATYQVPGTL